MAHAGKVSGGRCSGEGGLGWVGSRGERLLGYDERERRRSNVHEGSHAHCGVGGAHSAEGADCRLKVVRLTDPQISFSPY